MNYVWETAYNKSESCETRGLDSWKFRLNSYSKEQLDWQFYAQLLSLSAVLSGPWHMLSVEDSPLNVAYEIARVVATRNYSCIELQFYNVHLQRKVKKRLSLNDQDVI